MTCSTLQCDCGSIVTVWATILREGQPAATKCLNCLDLDATHEDTESGLIEVRCEHCKNLFATDPEHATFFCSMTCELTWRAGRKFEAIPW